MCGYADEAVAHHRAINQNAHFIKKPPIVCRFAGRLRGVLDGN
jgi:hypothetical protein